MTVNHYATTRNRMRISIAPKLICALLVTTGLTSTVAFAQSETAESSDAQLQDIVLTAQRRSERLQDTPAAVSAFNQEAIQSSGVANLADLSHVATSLHGSTTHGLYLPLLRCAGNNIGDCT